MTIIKSQLSLNKDIRKKMVPYLLIAPVIIYYSVFWLFPVLRAIMESFKDVNGVLTMGNYIHIFKSSVFYEALANTAFLVIFSVSIEFVLAFALALLINVRFKGSSIFLFLAMIPMSLPAVAVGAIWSSGLATRGWLNSFLMHFGFVDDAGKFIFLAGG
ncbi:MAG: sugar ABC transporter permease, partial [Spirochaetales bacterium]|nr:sugar ABC transporter permease [Spirochaetales bacterium]